MTSKYETDARLTANALPSLANECLVRRVAPGCVLVFLDVDVPEVAATGFVVVDLLRALKLAKKGQAA